MMNGSATTRSRSYNAEAMRTAAADLRRVLTGTIGLAIMWAGLIDAFLGFPA